MGIDMKRFSDRRTTRLTLFAAAVAVAAAAVPIASSAATDHAAAAKPKIKTIEVKDDVYSVAKLTVTEGQEIKWVWSKDNLDSHNVTLIKGPKGVKFSKYTSATGTYGIKFERVFMTPGTYHFQCTIHPESMNTILTVKK
jgi:plastocyanin